MNYKQIIESIIEACEPLANYPDPIYENAFEALLYDAFRNSKEPIGDDTDIADRAETDPPTDN